MRALALISALAAACAFAATVTIGGTISVGPRPQVSRPIPPGICRCQANWCHCNAGAEGVMHFFMEADGCRRGPEPFPSTP